MTVMTTVKPFNKKKCLQLIRLYKSKPELWNSKHKFHNVSSITYNAWKDIAKKTNSGVEAAKTKIRNLLAYFRRERLKEKISADKDSNVAYVSKWYAYNSLQFAIENNEADFKVKLNATTKAEPEPKRKLRPIRKPLKVESAASESHSSTSKSFNSTSESNSSSAKVLNATPESHSSASKPHNSLSAYKFKTAPEPKPARHKIDGEKSSEESLKKFEKSYARDNCDVYGEHIAMKLRNYNTRTQSVVQHFINNIVFEADMGKYDDDSMFNFFPLSSDEPDESCSTSILSNVVRPKKGSKLVKL